MRTAIAILILCVAGIIDAQGYTKIPTNRDNECFATYHPRKSEVSITCSGNDQSRVLVYLDTLYTKMVDITGFYGESVTLYKDFEYESLNIYKAFVENRKFTIKMKYTVMTDLRYVLTLDPIQPHYTLLKIYDVAAL